MLAMKVPREKVDRIVHMTMEELWSVIAKASEEKWKRLMQRTLLCVVCSGKWRTDPIISMPARACKVDAGVIRISCCGSRLHVACIDRFGKWKGCRRCYTALNQGIMDDGTEMLTVKISRNAVQEQMGVASGSKFPNVWDIIKSCWLCQ
jgi:hypothetical protein